MVRLGYRVLWAWLGAGCLITLGHAQTYSEGRTAYINGEYGKALEIIQPLAEAGNADAQKMLGIMYDYGQGVEANPALALEWYIRSAEQGQTAVQYQVGAKYFKGENIPRDYTQAARWWSRAADGGQVDAQFNLGLMYFRGLGVEQDDARAAALFRDAAGQDHGLAQYSLGVMYASGRGLDQDYDAAREWFQKSADQGVAQAQYNLGILYENGSGVGRDLDLAREWYQRAAAQGLGQASDRLDALAQLPAADAPQAMTVSAGAQMPDATSYRYEEIAPNGIKREDWLRRQPANTYTLQIGSVTSENDLVNYLKSYGLEDDAAYIQVVIDGVTRYNAFYGLYDSYEEAERAVTDLPPAVRRVSPWIRNVGILQKMIN